ncbi:histidine-tRNA ligase [Vavraia culicis subsp. floridensis]|uniref:histidine--tRNA ligase n=1 Tax=Vavraia culicis (isolate floridensis) TaxID=948595 RepID=L2GQP5_VAVCU|nr:histidine-tRNA ligase [Vavraia culicis subsp. floridensis]ELA45934.1 histidine-tRNA ligase [Vavraia culicis subsp. floridensis]
MPSLRTPKGTVDFHPHDSKLIDSILSICKRHFNLHGARSIDTPTFELLSTLTNKYGEESKLIFELSDQGGDVCALRYDLTVPFARYLAQHRVMKMRRYQIGKVFRRDQPAITKGRYREFYQCDFDICGKYVPLLADAEVIKIAVDILKEFKIGECVVRLNHRRLLEALFMKVGIESEKMNAICSAIDKLDKMKFKEVRSEMIAKGCTLEQTREIEELVGITDLEEVRRRFNEINGAYEQMRDCVEDKRSDCEITQNQKNSKDSEHEIDEKRDTCSAVHGAVAKESETVRYVQIANKAIDEIKALMEFLKTFKVHENIRFDFTLARGLDYYTGIVFEGCYTSYPDVGSVVGGGRYDNLVKRFCKNDVPCVGMSVGVLRIFSILRERETRACDTQVYVMCARTSCLAERMELVNELWENGIEAEMNMGTRSDVYEQREYARKSGIRVIVTVGGDEMSRGGVSMWTEEGEQEVKREDVIAHIIRALERR